MLLDSLYWREPLWLWLLMIPTVLVLLGRYQQKRFWSRLADKELIPWLQVETNTNSSRFSQALLLSSWLMLVIALSGPRTPEYIPPEVRPKKETVIAIVDLSSSMQAVDVALDSKYMTRILAAKKLLKNWSSELPNRLRTGIIIFAGHAHWLLKPTDDIGLIKHHLNQLDHLVPPTLGNELSGAISLAKEKLSASQEATHLILLTDGDIDEIHRQKAELALFKLLEKHNNVHLNIIGIGGVESARIPTSRNKPLLIDNRPATTRLESQWLTQIASDTKSRYIDIKTASHQSLEKLLQLPSPRILPENFSMVLWQEWFGIPLSIGTLILLIALQFPKREKG